MLSTIFFFQFIILACICAWCVCSGGGSVPKGQWRSQNSSVKVILSFYYVWVLRVELRLPACPAHCFPKEPSPCPQHYNSLFWAHECECVRTHIPVCVVYMKARGHSWVGWSLRHHLACLFRQGVSLAWNSPKSSKALLRSPKVLPCPVPWPR